MKSYSNGWQVGLSILLVLASLLACVTLSSAKSQDQLDELYKAAKAEGEVVWQWSGAVKDMKPVGDAFRARYPGIRVTIISIGSTAIGTRIITESSAGKLSFDVASCVALYMMPVVQRGLLVKYDWTKIVDLDPNRIMFDGTFIYFGDTGRFWAYNKKLVPDHEMPRSWEDTLKPKWKGGKISLRAAPSGILPLWPLWKQDKPKALDYLKRLARQDVMLAQRQSEVTGRLETGECLIGIFRIEDAYENYENGGPVAPCPISPAVAMPVGVFIPKGGVKHPNAAKLLIAWMASKEGLDSFVKARQGLLYPAEASPAAKWLSGTRLSFTRVTSMEDIREFTGAFAETVIKTLGFMPE